MEPRAGTPSPGSAWVPPGTDGTLRAWQVGWQRWVFPGLWLVYLLQTVGGVHRYSHGSAAVLGYAIVVAFAAAYLAALPRGWSITTRWFWPWYLALYLLLVIECFLARDDAMVFSIYIAVITVAAHRRWASPVVVALALAVGLAPRIVPGWSGQVDYQTALVVLLVSFAMYGFFAVMRSNRALAAARAEVARLAAETERSRIARDLHDLLGHSLTTITVKAGLARRLAERGDERAAQEIAEVEQLARRTLGDVRAAVAGHRELTLAGEMATAREVLRATDIVAELPGSVDVVDPRYNELFAWVLREGVTNLVKHARASRCAVTLSAGSITIADNGRSDESHRSAGGSGLLGLRERVAAAGGRLDIERRSGWSLRVTMPDSTGPDNNTAQDGTAQDGTAQDGTAQDGTVQDDTVQDGTVQDGTGRDGTGPDDSDTAAVGTRPRLQTTAPPAIDAAARPGQGRS